MRELCTARLLITDKAIDPMEGRSRKTGAWMMASAGLNVGGAGKSTKTPSCKISLGDLSRPKNARDMPGLRHPAKTKKQTRVCHINIDMPAVVSEENNTKRFGELVMNPS